MILRIKILFLSILLDSTGGLEGGVAEVSIHTLYPPFFGQKSASKFFFSQKSAFTIDNLNLKSQHSKKNIGKSQHSNIFKPQSQLFGGV